MFSVDTRSPEAAPPTSSSLSSSLPTWATKLPLITAIFWVIKVLGTAAGDLATEALGMGLRNGMLVFGGVILLCWFGYKAGVDRVAAFWAAYILTRPLGASIGDFPTQDKQYGGIGLGAPLTSMLFLVAIVVLVAREEARLRRSAEIVDPAADRRGNLLWAVGTAVAVGLAATAISLTQPASAPTASARHHTRGSTVTCGASPRRTCAGLWDAPAIAATLAGWTRKTPCAWGGCAA